MSSEDTYRAQVALLRSWGYTVKEQPNCWGRSNGRDWNYGDRVGQVNHHFVCPMDLSEAQGFVDMLTNGYDETPGPVVPWSIDAAGTIYLISTGPANHSGMGSTEVLNAVLAGAAPPNAARQGLPNDFNGNSSYDGVELLHPGDSTPYPDAMINATVALNASRCIVLGQSANTSIMHYEHTDRKDDMSWRGGVNGDGGPELRRRVSALISGGGTTSTPTHVPTPIPTPAKDWFDDMTPAEREKLIHDIAFAVHHDEIDDHDHKDAKGNVVWAKTSLAGSIIDVFTTTRSNNGLLAGLVDAIKRALGGKK